MCPREGGDEDTLLYMREVEMELEAGGGTGAVESAGESSTAGHGLRREGGPRLGKCALPSSHPSLLH